SLRGSATHARATGALGKPAAQNGLILRSRALCDPLRFLDLVEPHAEGELLEPPASMNRLDEEGIELECAARQTVPVDPGKLAGVGIDHVLIALSDVTTARGSSPSRRFSTNARAPLHGLSPPGPTGFSHRTPRRQGRSARLARSR